MATCDYCAREVCLDCRDHEHTGVVLCPLHAAAERLVRALKDSLARFDSEIRSEYEGTSMLADRLAEANEARALLRELGEKT